MLVRTTLSEAGPGAGQKEVFTYRWSPLTKIYLEPKLSFGP